VELLTNEGLGHTLVIHTQNQEVIREFALQKPVNRILINTPAALGGIGATTNLIPALTLGCGAIGGGSTSDNVGPMNLLNIRMVGYGVRSIEELRQPNLSQTSCAPRTQDHRTSIFEDSRFTASSTATMATMATPSRVADCHDDRFAGSATLAKPCAAGDITEENVEHIIKEVLGRLSR